MSRSTHVRNVVIGTVLFLAATGTVSFLYGGRRSFGEWFNGRDVSIESILVGVGYGIAFGLIDNLLLLVGVDGLREVYGRLPGGSHPTLASLYGNTYSSVVSAFGASFVADIISHKTHVAKGPVWSQAVGMFLGCAVVIATRLMFSIQ